MWTLVGLVALHHFYMTLEFPCIGIGLRTVAALERQICTVLAFDVSLQVRLICTAELTVRAMVGLLACVCPHVFLQL